MEFPAIAIVGAACVLPDALAPEALWRNVRAARRSTTAAPPGLWGLPRASVLAPVDDARDGAWSDAGGYVTGFESVWDPRGFALPAESLAGLDPLFHYVLHGAREALRPVGHSGASDRAGLLVGNLSFPTYGMARFAESHWLAAQPELAGLAATSHGDPRNRFMSGLPARLAARALGLGGPCFSLDAACASGLYAIALACDALHDRRADLMVAGGVNRADDLFLHVGFSALSALSRSGQSKPFDRHADGLLPAEGAAFVALMRLDDALASGRTVLGVVRGVGLSNDGRGRGLLVPYERGQERALREALTRASLTAREVPYIECHATGTPVGDATELRSLTAAREGAPCVLGSLKANLGHLVTAAGAAGLLKVLGAFEHGELPPTPCDDPLPELLEGPLRLQREAAPWQGPLRAGVSAFGFGGNNAHLLVEALDETRASLRTHTAPPASKPRVAIVSMGARTGNAASTHALTEALLRGTPVTQPMDSLSVELEGLRSPPRMLQSAIAQQLAVLEAAREAVGTRALPSEKTLVLVGMGVDAEVARWGARWRAPLHTAALASKLGVAHDPALVAQTQDTFAPVLESDMVIGTMPNVPANRINAALDLAGAGFTVSAEEHSGTVALSLARRALEAGTADAALVAAVDLSHEPVHRAALHAVSGDDHGGDGAFALVLRRLDDARADGDTVLAVLADDAPDALSVPDERALDRSLGRPHAARSLRDVCVATLSLAHRHSLGTGLAAPALRARSALVRCSALESAPASIALHAGDARPHLSGPAPRIHLFAASSRETLAQRVSRNEPGGEGPVRLALWARGDDALRERTSSAAHWLRNGGRKPAGIALRESALGGELAFVFTGAAAAYAGMGRELLLAVPSLAHEVTRSMPVDPSPWFDPSRGPRDVLETLWSASLLSQLHARLTLGPCALKPHATLGYSSGESNALAALGTWDDLSSMVRDSLTAPLFTRELGGAFEAPRRAWAREGLTGERWEMVRVLAPVDVVRAHLEGERQVRLAIIHTDDDVVLGGEPSALGRVLDSLGRERTLPVGYDLVAHSPELAEVRDAWWNYHLRPTHPQRDVRHYSGARGASFTPTAEECATVITEQAVRTLDLRPVILRAWEDGVRVFLEHGPRGLCSGWITRVLGDRPHLAVPLDQAGRDSIDAFLDAAIELLAAGIALDADALLATLSQGAAPSPARGPQLVVPAHPPAIRWPAWSSPAATLSPAPALPLAHDDAPPPAAPMPTVPPPATRTPSAAPAAAPAAAPSPSLDLLRAAQQRVAEVHRQHVAVQQSLHARFLAQHDLATRTLLGAAHGLPRTAPTPRIAAPTPAPTLSPAPVPVPVPASAPAAPLFDRAALIRMSSGSIADDMGEAFRALDGFHRVVRMPMPPLLLADRVVRIDAEPCSMGTGSLITETDITHDAWYLSEEGRMPPGIMIESGQADLLLISWLGVDHLVRGERVYRLLGCELTWHGSLPQPGETLHYHIHIDGHAQLGDVRLFFFHYDCTVNGELRLSVRGGQAGFFTDAELADSKGVLWDPNEDLPTEHETRATPSVQTSRSHFPADAIAAFAHGRVWECFGDAFAATKAHVRTPSIPRDRLRLFDAVTAWEPEGGAFSRGYLCAERAIAPDDWFFAGHFHNDPCMPGTLMFEGCLQTMAFVMAALGCTLDNDGWRFEPVSEVPYKMVCRGQVTPASKLLVYEVHVRALTLGPIPTLVADLLCIVDGRKAFHARAMGLRLVPDWPLTRWRHLGPPSTQPASMLVPQRAQAGLVGLDDKHVVADSEGFRFDYASLLACALGRPSEAFGPFYSVFDSTRRVARLPGPPYHFMTRVVSVSQPVGQMESGITLEVDYELPEQVWYLADNGAPVMPYCVLMEAALQPCGWLASYVGCARVNDEDVLFRNLDGKATVEAEVSPSGGALRTRATLTSLSRGAGMTLVSFHVECFQGSQRVYVLDTGFGFFPPEAFRSQVGLAVSDEQRARVNQPGNTRLDLEPSPARYCGGTARVAGTMLRMFDRVTGYWPEGGRAGLGYARAEKTVDAAEWFFKAHFFQDPVQPGSLGVEALVQLLQWMMLERGMADGMRAPRFEAVATHRPHKWKYRGQVVPSARTVTLEVELTAMGTDPRGRHAVANASLWVDGLRIYELTDLAMRLVDAPAPLRLPAPSYTELSLDPALEPWLFDHCPTWTFPSLPALCIADLLAAGAVQQVGGSLREVRKVELLRWVAFAHGAVALRVQLDSVHDEGSLRIAHMTLLAWRDASNPALSRFEPAATAECVLAATHDTEPAPWPAPPPFNKPSAPLPYETGALFHGPAFRALTALHPIERGAWGTLDAARCTVPAGLLSPGLLDAALHVIPHDALERWEPSLPPEHAAYPLRLERLVHHAPLPRDAQLRVRARSLGLDAHGRPRIEVLVGTEAGVCTQLELVEVLLPKGPLGRLAPDARRAFLRDRTWSPGAALASTSADETALERAVVTATDWLPGNVAHLYALDDSLDRDLAVAVKDHLARRTQLHPAYVLAETDGARTTLAPLERYPLTITSDATRVRVHDAGPPSRNFDAVMAHWRAVLDTGPWLGEDLFRALLERFVASVRFTAPDALSRLRGRGALFLANHQVGVESMLFTVVSAALTRTQVTVVVKAEHRDSWIGTLASQLFARPGLRPLELMRYFDRANPAGLLPLLAQVREDAERTPQSLLVHVDGTRALSCTQPVERVSGALLDLALAAQMPVVPVRFTGGLPAEPLDARIEFPLGMGAQTVYLGEPLEPATLATLPLKERVERVRDAINNLAHDTGPAPGDPAFAAEAAAWSASTSVNMIDAVLWAALSPSRTPSEDTRRLLDAARAGRFDEGSDALGPWLAVLAKRLLGR